MTNNPSTSQYELPGKEAGVHAGWDDGGELVYIGLGTMVMHKHVIDKFYREWDEVYGNQ